VNRAVNSIEPVLRLAAAGLALAVVVALSWPAPSPAGSVWVEDWTEVGETKFTTGQSILNLPEGLRSAEVEAVGGKGADKGTILGGQPAEVKGRIAVTSGGRLYILVAGDGSGTDGGFNGGGDAMFASAAAVGGGGGGATDIRTIEPGEPGSLESRLIVAAGGGGAGSTANGGGKAGGAGGHAGVMGGRAESAGPGNTVGSGGFGGGVGAESVPGLGGGPGYPYAGSPGFGQTGHSGNDGSLGTGGDGGAGPPSTPAGWGGGGGGGVFGGGGGGGGGTMTSGTPTATGGGGGGGGSLLVPAGGIAALESRPSTPSVLFQYTIPGTEISSGPPEAHDSTSAAFEIASTEEGSILECQMDFEGYEVCESPFEPSGLGQGPHTLRVRSVNSMDNFDPTPAVWSFSVDSIAPVTSIDGGPDGRTEIRRPEFRFSANEPNVTFSCRFDSDDFGPCAEAGSEIPGSALSYAPHTFAVRATDPTGNVGPAATRSFEVVEGSGTGRPAVPRRPTLKLGRPKLKPKRGMALLPVTVSGAGRVKLIGTKRVKAHAIGVEGPATVRLKVRAKGSGLKKLHRKRRLTLTAAVSFVASDGTGIVRKKKLTLKLKAVKKRS